MKKNNIIYPRIFGIEDIIPKTCECPPPLKIDAMLLSFNHSIKEMLRVRDALTILKNSEPNEYNKSYYEGVTHGIEISMGQQWELLIEPVLFGKATYKTKESLSKTLTEILKLKKDYEDFIKNIKTFNF